MQAAPETGHHTVPDSLRDEALSHFFTEPTTATPTSGGVNNCCQYIDTASGERYILRVYNNGGQSKKVHFEHEVLAQLGKQKLSFQVPQAKLTLADSQPYVKLSRCGAGVSLEGGWVVAAPEAEGVYRGCLPPPWNPGVHHPRQRPQPTSRDRHRSGDDACVFEIIPGTLAKTTSPQEVGRATGELCTAMGRLDMGGREREAPVHPYYDVFAVHHSINRDIFYQQVRACGGRDAVGGGPAMDGRS